MDSNRTEKEGVTLWRQIEETLVGEIEHGRITPGSRLPTSEELATRFGVNRHTVLRAIARLQDEGLVRVERGRGAFVVDDALQYRLGARTRFEANLLQNNRKPSRGLISVVELPASAEIAAAMDLKSGAPLIEITLVGEADGLPISVGRNYFSKKRLPDVAEAFRRAAKTPQSKLSITTTLATLGVKEYQRKSIRIRSRVPTKEEGRLLRIASSESVLETEVINVAGRKPVMYSVTAFSSSRVEFFLEF